MLMKSVSTRFSLLAQRSRSIGAPIERAYHAARILPKLPVGTQTSIGSPAAIFPSRTMTAYADR